MTTKTHRGKRPRQLPSCNVHKPELTHLSRKNLQKSKPQFSEDHPTNKLSLQVNKVHSNIVHYLYVCEN